MSAVWTTSTMKQGRDRSISSFCASPSYISLYVVIFFIIIIMIVYRYSRHIWDTGGRRGICWQNMLGDPMKSRVYPEQEVGTNVSPNIQLRAIDPRRLQLHMVWTWNIRLRAQPIYCSTLKSIKTALQRTSVSISNRSGLVNVFGVFLFL